MRIIDKQEFYSLPKNTLYMNYKPICIRGLKIKGDTIYNLNKDPIDFYYIDLIDNVDYTSSEEQMDLLLNKEEFTMNYEIETRDAMFDEEELYIVFDNDTIKKLILALEKTLK